MILNDTFWSDRYKNNETQWDLGEASPPLRNYLDQVVNKDLRTLFPGCGNAHDAAYAFNNGFKHIFLLDWSKEPLGNFANAHPAFPRGQLINQNFFDHQAQYDLIMEQTFFCAINPALRNDYARHAHELLAPGGKIAGVMFEKVFEKDGPPFGGLRDDYRPIFEPFFDILTFETCYNSIEPRQGFELFIILQKKA